jgi:hypothetical protein
MLQFLFPCFLLSWVVADIRTESSCCFQKCNRNPGCRLSRMVCPKVWADYCILIHTHCQELMKSVVVMAACHCYSWWRLWLHSLSYYLKFLLSRILCNFIYIYIYAFFSLWVWLGGWWVCSPIMHMAEFVNPSISCSELIGFVHVTFSCTGSILDRGGSDSFKSCC